MRTERLGHLQQLLPAEQRALRLGVVQPALSPYRSDAIVAELVVCVISRSKITVTAYGESRSQVPPDGVREPQNRPVEIALR
jgi:outer membrane protein OmpA-like peptidoglycan-associated protein